MHLGMPRIAECSRISVGSSFAILILILASTGCADLTIKSLTHDPQNPTNHDQITVTAVVENIGRRQSGESFVEIKVGGEMSGVSYLVPPLVPGDTHPVTRPVAPLPTGTYITRATADVNGDIDESNESNNERADHFTVSSAGASLMLPIADGDQARHEYGLWPFGVHGGGHPYDGHPGWDIEYAAGAKVRASAAGVVSEIVAVQEFPNQWRVNIEHGAGLETTYEHVEDLLVQGGEQVSAGQPLGNAGTIGDAFHMIHFGVRENFDEVCPLDYLSASAIVHCDLIWQTAAYGEELTEPFPCNALNVSFPVVRIWQRASGNLSIIIEFVRLTPERYEHRYSLRDSRFGPVTETGKVRLQPNALPNAGHIELLPSSGPPKLGIYRITGGEMLIDWGTTRPANLSRGSRYTSAP